MNHTATMKNTSAFAVMTSLFFIWGFITALNDILIPHLKAAFDLSYVEAMLVQFAFFGAYFVISPFAGRWVEMMGYVKGVILGLCTIALGCGIFYPAAQLAVYEVFLLGLFVLAAGITILQVAANPYVAQLGNEATAASRLNLAQAINSLGHTMGPLFGAFLIFGAVSHVDGDSISPQSVQLPYLLIAGVMIITAIGFKFMKLPEIATAADAKLRSDEQVKVQGNIWSQPRLVFGALAIFLYVGAEVAIGSFLVNYFQYLDANSVTGRTDIAATDAQSVSQMALYSQMVSYYWGAAMMGRFVGALVTRYVSPAIVLAVNAVLAVVLLLTTMFTDGDIAIYSVIAVGFFNSIMFPTIFSLAIKGLGPLTSRGSGLLCQAIVGGAILPLMQAVIADNVSIQFSFIVPLMAYIYIVCYGYLTFTDNFKSQQPMQEARS